MQQLYSEKVMDHFRNPRNVGEMKDADGEATVGNPVCGDVMKFFVKIGKKGKKEFIKDVKFQTLGCGAAIATSSMATEMIKGKPLSEVEKLTKNAITDALDGLPPVKYHCSNLAAEGIQKAVEDYKKRLRD